MLTSRLAAALKHYVAPLLRRPSELQVAALCIRMRDGRREVLLITSRGSGRWILPKGWPMAGKTLAEAAAEEAWEEAGVRGRVEASALGGYSARKFGPGGLGRQSKVYVFRLEVARQEDDYPEAGQRKRKWVTPKRAAGMVREAGLRQLLLKL
ncbi:NUDIX hydrolase [Alkalilacustris brevis]|uniref:NUDIX hydrolase n=1 Tax=Alkalilacustris brevis TaxID=2026338 RepID=UPI000E0DAC6F|nr:NUDIX hydrolase [Alkalilacustris brevis]